MFGVRLRGFSPVLQGHTHALCLGERSELQFIMAHHRLADLVEANARIKALQGQSWMVDPRLEFVTPHHSVRWRLVMRNGGVLFRMGGSPETTAQALANSATRRELYEAGRYVPEEWLRIWPREEIVRWSRRDRPASWGEVGMLSRIPPPEDYGRTRRPQWHRHPNPRSEAD
jgi:hypothetical protein